MIVLALLFSWGISEGHETHLSTVGTLHQTSIKPCGFGAYAVDSEELGCQLLHKKGDLITGFTLHIEPIDYDKDGDCNCPKGDL
jgi:hypothetical protein